MMHKFVPLLQQKKLQPFFFAVLTVLALNLTTAEAEAEKNQRNDENTPPLQGRQLRQIHFPAGLTGTLFWARTGTPMYERDSFQKIGRCRENMTFPDNIILRLKIEPRYSSSISLLSRLGKNDLAGLELSYCRFKDSDWPNIAPLSNLLELRLTECDIHDQSTKCLLAFPKLQLLTLVRTDLGDSSMIYIGQLKALQFLALGGTSITDKGLNSLSKLDKLRTLDIEDTAITDRGVESIKAIGLRNLELSNTKISDTSLKILAGMPYLYSLSLNHCNVSDRGLQWLQQSKSLKTLSLRSTKVSAAGLAEFKQKLPGCQVTSTSRLRSADTL